VNAEGKAAVEGIERLGLLKITEPFFRESTARTGAAKAEAALARSPEMEALSERVLKMGRSLVGCFRWRGGSGPAWDEGWRISGATNKGYLNDFARWMRGGPKPGPNGTMNCWEAVMYTAHRAGAVDETTLRRLHTEATDAASAAHLATGDAGKAYSAYYKTISDYLGPGERTGFKIDQTTGIGGPDIPAGHVVFVDGTDHVMLSLGTRDAQGRQEVLSHWLFPERVPAGPITNQTFGIMQKTSVEEVLSTASKYLDNPRIESAEPSWLIEN
jgi:hypothetical protein